MSSAQFGLMVVTITLFACCSCQRANKCAPKDVRNLVYGQTFYTLNDTSGGDMNLALRNISGQRIHPQYVAEPDVDNTTFIIKVPNIFRGVAMKRITMLTRNVERVVVTLTKESEIEENEHGKLEVFSGGVATLVNDLYPINLFQRTSFWILGEIGAVEISFQRRDKGRMKIQKLFISACKGKEVN